MNNKINISCLCGSLRKPSYNMAVLQAIKMLAPGYITISIFEHIGGLPLFNPDIENDNIMSVQILRDNIRNADGLIIASPEYAHGISGVMKNALDWLVSGDEFPYKPVALINTSPRAHHAQEALREVLITMSATIVDNACITVPLLGSGFDADLISEHTKLSKILLTQLDTFCHTISAL